MAEQLELRMYRIPRDCNMKLGDLRLFESVSLTEAVRRCIAIGKIAYDYKKKEYQFQVLEPNVPARPLDLPVLGSLDDSSRIRLEINYNHETLQALESMAVDSHFTVESVLAWCVDVKSTMIASPGSIGITKNGKRILEIVFMP